VAAAHDAEQRRQQVDDRHGDEGRDEQACKKQRHRVTAAEFAHFVQSVEPQRRQLEIFPAEQIGVGDEEDDRVDARQQEEDQREQVHRERDGGEFARQKDGLPRRQGAAACAFGIGLALGEFREIVQKEARDQHRDRRDEEGEADDQPDAERHRDRRGDPGIGEPGGIKQIADEELVEPDPHQHKQRQRQRQHLPERRPKRRREHLVQRIIGGSEYLHPHARRSGSDPARKMGARLRRRKRLRRLPEPTG